MGDRIGSETGIAASCPACGRQPIGSYAPNPTRPYLCPYCNETAMLRDEGVIVDRFHNVCHEDCLAKAQRSDQPAQVERHCTCIADGFAGCEQDPNCIVHGDFTNQTVTKSADSPITKERPRDAGTSGAAT